MSKTLIRTENLSIQFGALKAVNGMSLEIEKNKFTTILGPNGAGKTTFFNLLSGMLKPTEGKIFLNDVDITKYTPQERIMAGMGRSFQLTNVFPALTVFENVRLAVQSASGIGYKLFKDHRSFNEVNQRTEELLKQVLLAEKYNHLASEISHGEQRKLELAMVIALKPEVLLLDEPTAGMSIEEVPTMIKLLHEIKDSGTTILLIEHKMNMVKALSDVLIIMVNGELLCQGHPDEVTQNPTVMKAYLGGGVIDVTA